jgi:phosphatidylglycerophosphatase A
MIQNEQAPHEKVPSVSMLLDLGHFLSLGCGLGLIRFAPGTFGALLGIVMYLPLSTLPTSNYVFVCLTLFILGVAVCHRTSQTLGGKDHGSIVWDETVGMLMTLSFCSSGPIGIFVGFVAFRFFDVLKPWPIAKIDKEVGGGFGIMFDDFLAAVYAASCLEIFETLMMAKRL